MDYLVFQLYGPMASWGAPAVGEARPSSDHPGRSALLGLIAASLGVRRDDSATQQALGFSLMFAVKQLTPGTLIRDFHTIQVPGRNRKAQYRTRKEEMALPKDRLNTIISRREYRCDGLWRVAVSLTAKSDWTLQELAEALQRPAFTPYLGRKACPLAAPLSPRVVEASGIREALSSGFSAIHDEQARWLGQSNTSDFFWEGTAGDIDIQDTRYPEDDVVSRARWQFMGRTEHHARIKEAP
jgi:CRISPR system Cascade subunit CasD